MQKAQGQPQRRPTPGRPFAARFLARAVPVLPIFKNDQNAASAIFQPAPPSANSHTEPLRATQRPDQVLNTPSTPNHSVPHAQHHHWAAQAEAEGERSEGEGEAQDRPVDPDDQTAPATLAVPISFGSSTCRPDASGIVAALMGCAFTRKPQKKSASLPNVKGLAGIMTIFSRCFKIKMRWPW